MKKLLMMLTTCAIVLVSAGASAGPPGQTSAKEKLQASDLLSFTPGVSAVNVEASALEVYATEAFVAQAPQMISVLQNPEAVQHVQSMHRLPETPSVFFRHPVKKTIRYLRCEGADRV